MPKAFWIAYDIPVEQPTKSQHSMRVMEFATSAPEALERAKTIADPLLI
jgi:hypothetical protein